MMILQTCFLLFFTLQYSVKANLFPSNSTVQYEYDAEVRTGVDEPVPYTSRFKIAASLNVQSDPAFDNAYVMQLANVKYGMHNGLDILAEKPLDRPIPELASAIQDPFWILYDENNLIMGLKFQNEESGWSKNIKKAIAVGFQVDFSKVNFTDNLKRTEFLSKEKTLHGTCEISYNVQTSRDVSLRLAKDIVVTKVYEPTKCTNFSTKLSEDAKSLKCPIKPKTDLVTSVKKKVYFHRNGKSLNLEKLTSRETFYFSPWMSSEVHNVQISQTLKHFKLIRREDKLSQINFQSIPITSDISYEKPNTTFSLNATEDITQGRRKINQSELITRVNDLFFEAADYFEENHLNLNLSNVKHAQIMNRLLADMVYLNLESIDTIYDNFEDFESIRENTARNLFLEMIPYVGTTASCLFIRNAITQRPLKYSRALLMLEKLPLNVRQPSEQLLQEMEDLIYMKKSEISFRDDKIKRAAILSFASLVHVTFERHTGEENPPLLEKYLQYINQTIRYTSKPEHVDDVDDDDDDDFDYDVDYETKMAYIMALRNIKFGKIERFLVPLINGSVVIHETRVERTRLFASLALAPSIKHNKQLTHDLYWPIFVNSSNTIKLRITAYEMLMSQLPDEELAMSIHRFMENEKNEQLYNYHYTTIKSLARLQDPCLRSTKEMARKILALTKARNVRGNLSGSYQVDYANEKYGYIESLKLALRMDDKSGVPSMAQFEYYSSEERGPGPYKGLYYNTNSLKLFLNILKRLMTDKKIMISDNRVKEFLHKIAERTVFKIQALNYIEFIEISDGRIVQVFSCDLAKLTDLEHFLNIGLTILKRMIFTRDRSISFRNSWQNVQYTNQDEISVPTDIGIPVSFYNRRYFSFSKQTRANVTLSQLVSNVTLENDFRIWRHRLYEVAIYNPIADVYHSVQRFSTEDLIYPITTVFTYDLKGENINCRIIQSSDTKSKGVRRYATSLVTVSSDENNILKESCPSCRNYEVVLLNNSTKAKKHEIEFDLELLKVNYTQINIDCKYGPSLMTLREEWIKIKNNEDIKLTNDLFYIFFVGLLLKRFNYEIAQNSGICSELLFSAEDISNVSYVDLNFNWAAKNSNEFSSEGLNLRVSLDIISAINKSSIYFWEWNIISNASKVDLTFINKLPGKENLVGCMQFDGSVVPLQFTLSQSKSDQCNFGENLINYSIRSKELKESFDQGCSNNIRSPINSTDLQNSQLIRNCVSQVNETQGSKRYDINISYKKEIPQEILSMIGLLEDNITSLVLSNVKYSDNHTEKGNIMLNLVESPKELKTNVEIFTPSRSYEFSVPLTLSAFNVLPVKLYNNEEICSILPETILRNTTSSFKYWWDWILISADYTYYTYAVFVRLDKNNSMEMKLYHRSHILTIEPQNSNLEVLFDYDPIPNSKKEITLPDDVESPKDSLLRMQVDEDRVEIQLIRIPVNISYSKYNLTLSVKSPFQGDIEGLCTDL